MISEYFLSLFIATFVLEDVALATMLALVAQGKISFLDGFAACFTGIALGDLGLYYIGFVASRFPIEKKWSWIGRVKVQVQKLNAPSMGWAVFGCRFIPGTRVVTYLAAGLSGFSQVQFLMLTILSVGLWVGFALIGGKLFEAFLAEHFWKSMLAALIFLLLLRKVFFLSLNPWKRKIYFNSFRKYLNFEFWPPWLFYPPVIVYLIILMIRYRSLTLLLDANPRILFGGLLGESKWDYYQYFLDHPFSLKTFKISESSRQQKIQELLNLGQLKFPFILKPDIGQRGFAVRIIRESAQLDQYLADANFDLIAQEYCDWQNEAGIFYIRKPLEKKGFLFSVTDKKFPFVVGDGVTQIGNLILNDKRARIMAGTYIERAGTRVEEILKPGEKFYLSECGNHCQGALFFNGRDLMTDELTESIEKVALMIPDFHFGRFDIRYESVSALKKGVGIKIVEVNGAGSEATHIWDPKTSLLDAYKTLFTQWDYLFEIGYLVRKNKMNALNNSVLKLGKAYYKMLTQKKELGSSS